MTFELLQLFAGISLIFVSVTYAVWCKVRVTFLREDLFQIRDKLWDEMRKLDALDHPAYKIHRDFLNRCIRSAHLISVPTILQFALLYKPKITKLTKKDEQEIFPDDTPPAVRKALNVAVPAAVAVLYKYTVRHRVSGWFLIALLGTTTAVHKMLADWAKSDGPKRLDHADRAGAAI